MEFSNNQSTALCQSSRNGHTCYTPDRTLLMSHLSAVDFIRKMSSRRRPCLLWTPAGEVDHQVHSVTHTFSWKFHKKCTQKWNLCSDEHTISWFIQMWDDFIGFFHTQCKSGYKFLQQQISFFKQIFQIGRQKLAIFLCSVRCWASHPAVSLRGQQTGKVLNLSIFSSFYFRLEEAPHVGHDVFVRFDPSTPFQSAKIPSRSIFR